MAGSAIGPPAVSSKPWWRFHSASKPKGSFLQWRCALHRARLLCRRMEAMPSKQPSKKKYEKSACPKSYALVGRCNAGGPAQIRLKHPLGLLGPENMSKAGVRNVDAVYRCTYCGVIYVSVGIPGMERFIGTWAAHGFVLDVSLGEKRPSLLVRQAS